MPRTAKNENITLYSTYRRREYAPDGSLVSDGEEQRQSVRRIEIRNTVDTPGFRSFRHTRGSSREDLPMNPFGYFLSTQTLPTGTRTTEFSDGTIVFEDGVSIHSYVPELLEIPNDVMARLESEAVNLSLTGLKDQKVNLGIAFASRQQTVDLVLQSAKRVASGLRDLKSGNFSRAWRSLGGKGPVPRRPGAKGKSQSKALADDWLALQFGWKPLLDDVYGAAEQLAKIYQRPVRSRISRSRTWNGAEVTSHPSWGIISEVRKTASVTVKYVYVFSVSSQIVTDLSSVGITNPATVLWDKLPWSFVIDWFVPVGTFIDALDASLGLSFEKGCKTVFQKSRSISDGRGSASWGGWSYRGSMKSTNTLVECSRTPLSAFPSPSVPVFSPRFSNSKAVTLSALIYQQLAKLKEKP